MLCIGGALEVSAVVHGGLSLESEERTACTRAHLRTLEHARVGRLVRGSGDGPSEEARASKNLKARQQLAGAVKVLHT